MKRIKKFWWLFVIILIAVGVFITVKTGWKFLKEDLAKQPQEKSIVKPLLQDELKRMIVAASDSLYQINFANFVLNIDSGKGLIKDIRLTADSSIYKKRLAKYNAPNIMMNMHADSINQVKNNRLH